MFTGIIEEIGTVIDLKKTSSGAEIIIECSKVLEDTKIGDSIAISGVCQTVVQMSDKSFKADVSNETLKVTTFLELKKGDKVNLERALTLNERLGGHIVLGHVDGIAQIISSKKESDFYTVKFKVTEDENRCIVKKGSITINGISLTVADVQDNIVTVAVIPHTYENTNLKFLKTNQNVNIETDVFAKYIEKFLLNEKTTSMISEDFLKENGFL
ncbi:MAG: riboflavin synthase [Candidatus Gastranaerophilaceae bacterium]